MSRVLFDLPGPRARARHRIASIITIVVLLAIAGWVLWQLYQADQFTMQKWEPFVTPRYVMALLEGLLVTVTVAAVSIVLAIIFGVVFGAGRLSDHWLIRWPCFLIVEFFRAVPVLMMIFAISIMWVEQIGKFWSLAIALTLYNGSVLAEVFRAGILAVPKGQREAGYAIGLRKSGVMMLILIPQAVTIMLPAIISQCVVALKDTALGYVIPYNDIVSIGKDISEEFGNIVATATVLATVFIIINYSLSRLARWVEARLSRRGRSAATTTAPGDVGPGGQTVAGGGVAGA